MLGSIFSVAAVALCLATGATATPHPDSFAARLRHGPLFAAAKAQHEALSARATNSTASWITQPIFHTGAPNEPTFQQRYYVDYSALIASGYKSRNLMLYINGESAVDSTPNGFIQTFADNFSAPIITLEHRFYGESMPYQLTDYQNVYKALTVDYALQDMKYFVDYFVANVLVPMIRANDPSIGPNDTVPITVFCGGGSYSGALSSWMKQKYPDTFKFAWSSSGVVYPMFDFTTFDGHVKHVISSNCLTAVQQAMQQFSTAYDINATYVTMDLLQSQSYFAKTDLAWMLADGSAMQVQYGSKETLCTTLLDPNLASSLPYPQDATTLLLQRLVLSIQKVWGASFTSSCYYSTACLADQQYQSQWAAAGYSWVAQTCFQMAWWQVGYRNSIRLPIITTEYYTNQCRSVFRNASLIANVYQFNAVYGGRTANTAVNVIATQGSDDPWSEAGMQVGIPAQNYFVYWAQCPGCGHCGDMQVATPQDPANLVAQRQNLLIAANAMYNGVPVPGSNNGPSSATTGTKNNSKIMAAIFCSLAAGVVLLIIVAVFAARARAAKKQSDRDDDDYRAGLNRGESAFP